MRTFIALELPDSFRFEVEGLARQLSGIVRGRFAKPEAYHVTLAFLGDASRRDVQLAEDALEAACAHATPVPLGSDGLGAFGKARDATLWLGLRPADSLASLAEKVRAELAARQVAFDEKPFKPHITLARRASIPGGALPALVFPAPAEAVAVTLFKSELSPDGAVYTPLHTIALGL